MSVEKCLIVTQKSVVKGAFFGKKSVDKGLILAPHLPLRRLQVIPAFCHTGPSRTGPAAGVTSHSGSHAWSVRPPHNHGVVLTARSVFKYTLTKFVFYLQTDNAAVVVWDQLVNADKHLWLETTTDTWESAMLQRKARSMHAGVIQV